MSAAVASDCKLIYYGCYGVTFYLKISKLMSKKMRSCKIAFLFEVPKLFILSHRCL